MCSDAHSITLKETVVFWGVGGIVKDSDR